MKPDWACYKGNSSPRIVKRLSMQDLFLKECMIHARFSAGPESINKPFCLIRTYDFKNEDGCGEYKGYEVTEYQNIKDMVKDVNKQIDKVYNQRSILTRGLGLKLESD